MKIKILSLVLLVCLISLSFVAKNWDSDSHLKNTRTEMENDSLLRHVVLFKFKTESSAEDVATIVKAFGELPSKIPQIASYEWGLNNSPEGLNKGLTHCFFVTFKSEEDRAAYLPHPDHKAFVALLGPHLDDVTVVDYWTSD